MLKLTVFLAIVVAICAVAADPVRQNPLRKQLLARQRLQPTVAAAGYPPAGVTPSVPFELPTQTEQTDAYVPPEIEEALQPDKVYGSPESETQQTDTIYGPPEVQTQQPDSVYGPPDPQTEQTYPPDSNAEIDDVNIEEVATRLEPSEEEAEKLDEPEEVLVDEDGSIIAISTTFDQANFENKPARLVYQRFPQRRQQPTPLPAQLTKAKYRARYQSF